MTEQLRECEGCGALTPNVRRCTTCRRKSSTRVSMGRPKVLTEAQCLEVIQHLRSGMRGRKLAAMYGVSYDTLRRVAQHYGVGLRERHSECALDCSKPPPPPPGFSERDLTLCKPLR